MKCAKAELQTCGGPSDSLGKCANGLQCLKTCLSCQTVGSSGTPCVFPFNYRDNTYNKCTSKDSDNGQPWCATATAEDGFVVDGAWGDCDEGCPGTRIECDDRYFSILEGSCIDPAVPGAIPNWFGAPAVKLLDTTKDLFPAPFCATKGANKRKYKNTCRCAEGETAVDYGGDGRPRGNCTGADENVGDNVDKVFCFLENIRDPLDPFSGCYSDTKWSSRDGRFWSSLACTLAPDVGYEEKSTGTRNKPNKNPRKKPTANPRRDEQIRKRLNDRRPGPKATTRRTTKRPTTTSIKPEVTTPGDYYSVFEYNGEDYVDYSDYKQAEVEATTVFEPIIINDRKSNAAGGNRRRNEISRRRGENSREIDNEPDEEKFVFIPGKTNLKGFSEEVRSDYDGEEYYYDEIATDDNEEKVHTEIVGPFLPTPVPSRPAQVQTTQRPRKRRPITPRPRRRDHTEFPNFKRRTNRPNRNKQRPNFDPRRRKSSKRKPTRVTTVNPIERREDNFLDIESRTQIPSSFLEGEFGAENIPIAIPLFSEEIFQKIITTSSPEVISPPSLHFDGAILLGVETQTKKSRNNQIKPIPDYPDQDNNIQQGGPGTAIRLDASSFFEEESNDEQIENNFENIENDSESIIDEEVTFEDIDEEVTLEEIKKSEDNKRIEKKSMPNDEVNQSEVNDEDSQVTEKINLFKNLPSISDGIITTRTPIKLKTKIQKIKTTQKPTLQTTIQTVFIFDDFESTESSAESIKTTAKRSSKQVDSTESFIQDDSTESSSEPNKTTPKKSTKIETIDENPRSTQQKQNFEGEGEINQKAEITGDDITDKIKNVIDLGVLGLWSNAKPRKPRDQFTSPMPVFRPSKQGTDKKINR